MALLICRVSVSFTIAEHNYSREIANIDLDYHSTTSHDDLKKDIYETAKAIKILEDDIYWPQMYRQHEHDSSQMNDSYQRRLKKNKRRSYKKKKAKSDHKSSRGDTSLKKSKKKGALSIDLRSTCANPSSTVVPCAPSDLDSLCDKYGEGDFKSCYLACKPSFCCIHDSKSTSLAKSCSSERNCAQYSSCYIVWWKLHDTIGPANFVHVNQDDEFFNMPFEELREDLEEDEEFFNQFFGHHFDTDDPITEDKIEDSSNW